MKKRSSFSHTSLCLWTFFTCVLNFYNKTQRTKWCITKREPFFLILIKILTGNSMRMFLLTFNYHLEWVILIYLMSQNLMCCGITDYQKKTGKGLDIIWTNNSADVVVHWRLSTPLHKRKKKMKLPNKT